MQKLILNLGGEGEVKGAINQQPEFRDVTDGTARDGELTLKQMIREGVPFLFCENCRLPFPDNSVDIVYANNVPIDISTMAGPGVQTSEIYRIIRKSGDSMGKFFLNSQEISIDELRPQKT